MAAQVVVGGRLIVAQQHSWIGGRRGRGQASEVEGMNIDSGSRRKVYKSVYYCCGSLEPVGVRVKWYTECTGGSQQRVWAATLQERKNCCFV
jgi:hypothetical protein